MGFRLPVLLKVPTSFLCIVTMITQAPEVPICNIISYKHLSLRGGGGGGGWSRYNLETNLICPKWHSVYKKTVCTLIL